MAQQVKNLPAMREIRVWSLGWEDPLEEGMATHSSILAWRIPMDRGAWRAIVQRVAKNQTWIQTKTHMDHLNMIVLFIEPLSTYRQNKFSHIISDISAKNLEVNNKNKKKYSQNIIFFEE